MKVRRAATVATYQCIIVYEAVVLMRSLSFLACFRMLTNNKIKFLESGCLDNLTSLEVLKLRKNKIVKLPKQIFEKLGRLKRLWVYVEKLSSHTARYLLDKKIGGWFVLESIDAQCPSCVFWEPYCASFILLSPHVVCRLQSVVLLQHISWLWTRRNFLC